MLENVKDDSNIHIIIDDLCIGAEGIVIITDRDNSRHSVKVCLVCDGVPKYPHVMDMLVGARADWGSIFISGERKFYVGVREV